MMPGRIGNMPLSAENPLGLSWHDSALIPLLNPTNIMDYFSERSNPFFDRTCNNEVIKMQRLSMDQLQNMTGLEYILLHVQEPILYVIRKQHRHSPTHVTPLGDYYIIAGFVYQAPDLASVLNSRLLSSVHHLQTSFEEALNFSRYHPSKGYWWDFVNKIGPDRFNPSSSTQKNGQVSKQTPLTTKEDTTTLFQCQRVDMLLADLLRQFPLPAAPQNTPNQQGNAVSVKLENNADSKQQDVKTNETNNVQIKQEPEDSANTPTELTNGNVISHMDIKQEIKQENMKPPLEKKARM